MTHTLLNRLLLLTVVSGLAGCGGKPAAEPPPLSVADWKAMPVDQKYTPEALERLKRGDPKLETPEGWEAFSRTTLAAARKKDFAAKKRR
jgi:hypothetical protein